MSMRNLNARWSIRTSWLVIGSVNLLAWAALGKLVALVA